VATPSLRELQSLFWASLNGRHEATLRAVVSSTPELCGEERLTIYAEMYFARLRDVLADDFEKTAAALGPEGFTAVARAYLAEHPSEHPSVRHVGRHLAAFLASRPPPDTPPWLPDMARLEWARIEVFDAPDAQPIGMADLLALPGAEWPTARLRTIPALEVITSDWPLHLVWSDGAEPVRTPTVLRVWRQDGRVYHCAMDPVERSAFAALRGGRSFGEICDTMAGLGPAEAPAEAAALVARWVEDGLVAGIR
jgi:hypothetical protein